MKFNFHFLFIITIALPCYSMEIIQKITAVKCPRFVRYLTEDRVVIASNFACSIVNPNTNEEIAILKQCFMVDPHLAIHQNRKKIALSCQNAVRIYDAQTHEKICSITKEGVQFSSSIFDPHDENIFVLCRPYGNNGNYIAKYNLTGEEEDPYIHDVCNHVALHPTKKIICFSKWNGIIYLLKSDDLAIALKIVEPSDLCTFCKYSPDGSNFIIGNEAKIIITDPKITHENLNDYPFLSIGQELFKDAFFYNRDTILATILENPNNSWIKYWNIKTQTPIYQQAFPSRIKHNIAFCPGKTKVMVICQNDECMIWPVPKKVIQEHNNLIKEKMLFPWLILNKYQSENPNMPDDVKIYILSKLHQLHDA